MPDGLLYRRKTGFEVIYDIVDMFRAYREPDGVGFDALVQQFFLGKLRMRRGSGMDHQAFHIRHICQQGENLKVIDKLPGFLLPALDLKCKDRSAAAREVFFIQGMVRVFRKGRMIDLIHLRIRVQKFYDLLRVLRMTFQPERQRFHSLKQQEGIER